MTERRVVVPLRYRRALVFVSEHSRASLNWSLFVAGAVLDVIVDIRKDSPTFLQHVCVELSAANKQMIYIPEGFAHGFQTLEENSELIYHHSEYYKAGVEGGLRYSDV